MRYAVIDMKKYKKIFLINLLLVVSFLVLAQAGNVMAKEENVGRYALIEQATGKVVNVILLDPSSNWSAPAGHIVIRSDKVGPGDIWDGANFQKPPPEEKPKSPVIQSDGNDIAELMQAAENSILPGDMVAVTSQGLTLRKTNKPYDRSIVGVVSVNPGIVLGRADNGMSVPVALTGRVSLKVSAENGPIVPGDAITSSSTPGVGMKATKPGRVVGIALEAYEGLQINGTQINGLITVLINPHWQGNDLAVQQNTVLTVENGTDPNAPAPLTLGSLAARVDGIEARVLALELKLNDAGNLTSSNSPPPPLTVSGGGGGGVTFPSTFLASMKEAIETLGAKISDGILTVKKLVADRVTTKEFEIIDKATGEIYCTWIENGEWIKVKTECKYLENATTTAPSPYEGPLRPSEGEAREGMGGEVGSATTSDSGVNATSTAP